MTMTNIHLRCVLAGPGNRDPLGRLAYSVQEAAAAIGLGKTKLYSLIAQGVLPSTQIGKRRLVPPPILKLSLQVN